jgi:protein TonB
MPATIEQSLTVTSHSTFEQEAPSRDVSMAAVLTLILWTGCLVLGLVGVVFPYARPVAPKKPEPVLKAEMLQVELTTEPLPPILQTPSASPAQPPALREIPVNLPEIPPLTAVAEPTAVAFSLPVEGPVAIVEPAKASFAAAPIVEPKRIVAPPVQVLTYGQGEGRQPAPEYPFRARREGQEGAVGIRFSVGENGRVLAAEAVQPSPWKLLNDAALRVVQERWRFSQGAVRLYEVSIRFQLTK